MIVRVTYKDSICELVFESPGDQLQLWDEKDGTLALTRTYGVTRRMLQDLEAGSVVLLGEARLEKLP